VSFRVDPGQVFGLIGPNRAGKTTLVKLLLSLIRPTAGQITRLGQPASDRRTLARIGYMHENQSFPRYWSAPGLLRYYGALALLPEPEVNKRVPELLRRVQLADRCREPIAQFSKGMVQRLALAQALLNDPDLLVLDEPTEGLDLPGRQLLREVITERRALGKSVLLVSHVLSEVEQVCDRLVILKGGRVVHSGPVSALTEATEGGEARSLEEAVGTFYERQRA
jgi:ABC-2 type transport system ATP-binding protein